MGEVVIRNAVEQDRYSVFLLAQELATSFAIERSAFDDSYFKLLTRTDALLAVASQGGSIVGYCLAFDHPAFFANGLVTWVEEIMVAQESRRSGVGKKLMAYVEQWAGERGSQMIALATRRAAAFYQAVGYTESATYFRKILTRTQ
jgi:GNAT superfamily N-acetyltransferase